ADVEIAAVHEQVFLGEARPERVELERGEHVDHEDLLADQKLEQADAGLVVIHVVGLGIEGDLVDAVEGGQQRRELVGPIDEGVGGRAGTHFDLQQTTQCNGKEAGNHVQAQALKKESISTGRSRL